MPLRKSTEHYRSKCKFAEERVCVSGNTHTQGKPSQPNSTQHKEKNGQKCKIQEVKNLSFLMEKNWFCGDSWSSREVPQQMKVCERTRLCFWQYAYPAQPNRTNQNRTKPSPRKKNGQKCDRQIEKMPVFEQEKLGFVPLRGALEQSPSK